MPSRREFLQTSAAATAGLALSTLPGRGLFAAEDAEPLWTISCTEYSLHRMIGAKKLDNLDYAAFVKKTFDIGAVEYWNRPFMAKAKDAKYIGEMKQRADDAGVKGTCILIDGEGDLGHPEVAQRESAVEKHKKWVEAAKTLGCDSIRVNARTNGKLPYEEQLEHAVDGLTRLSKWSADLEMAIIVENHGGLSSNGKWLAEVMATVDLDNCGTLPDFGNFHGYDRYQGVKETMPYAKLVSAKAHDFDDEGNETKTDYLKMMEIVVDSGYRGYVGIEFEGRKMPEVEGVKRTKALLEKVHAELVSA